MKHVPLRADIAALWATYKETADPVAREELILNYSPLVSTWPDGSPPTSLRPWTTPI